MVIHPEKTKAMIITTRQKHQLKEPKLNLFIGNKTIEQVNSHKMLGIYLDSDFSWHTQIKHLTKKLSKNVFLLSKLRKFVDTEHLKLFFDAHIMSHLNYSSTIWDNCCNDSFKHINSIYRRAVKTISPLENTTTEMKMKNLKILPLSEKLKHNKAILVHKIYYNKTPDYLNKLIVKAPTRYQSLNLLPPIPRIDLYKTSLSYSGSLIWNSLPTDLKVNMSTRAFRYKLNDYYLEKNILNI